MDSLLRATNLRGFVELVAELGADGLAYLRRYHIDPAVLADPEAYVRHRDVLQMVEACAVERDCPDFGLRLSQWQGLDILGPIAVIARNAATVLDGFAAIARYLHIHGPTLRLTSQGRNARGDYVFAYHIAGFEGRAIPQSYELSLANGVRILRLLGGADACMRRVRLAHARIAPAATYARLLGCSVDFAAASYGFELEAALAQRPVQAADAQTRELASRYLESRHAPGAATLPDRVCELIRRLLPTGQCSEVLVARELAMHPRRLQRHLAAAGLRYETMLDGERRELARQYLAQTGLSLGQITGLLGYADPPSLSRACRRWFGAPPGALRAALAQGQRVF